jgi:hypothetical protein
MKKKGLKPQAVTILGVVGILCFLAAPRIPGALNWPDITGQGFCAIAYLIGLVSCWRAAALYPKGSPVGLGWLALGGNCFLSIFRHLALNPLFAGVFGTRERVYLASQTIQLPALICVLVGMIAIWWGIYRLKLGFRIGWLDCAGVACAAAIVAWAFRNNLSLSHSGQGILGVLQPVSLGLLIAIGGVGFLLHGLASQMGGGQLAAVMRWIAVYALLRSGLTLTEAWRDLYTLPWWLVFYSVPWIFAFGAAYSCWLVDTVRRGIGKEFQPGWDTSGLTR